MPSCCFDVFMLHCGILGWTMAVRGVLMGLWLWAMQTSAVLLRHGMWAKTLFENSCVIVCIIF